MCNGIIHTSLNLDDYTIEYMNQKLNYYKALQIAASLSQEHKSFNQDFEIETR